MELTFTWKQWEILKRLASAQDRLEFTGYSVKASVNVGKAKEDSGQVAWDDETDTVIVTLPD